MQPLNYHVARVRREVPDTRTLDLTPSDGQPGFQFAPGQFNMLYVFGIGEVPISISGDPAQQESMAHTVRAVGPVSRAITSLKQGEIVGLRGPFGTPWPVEEARGRDMLMVAGGIGLAPLRPALYSLLGQRAEFGNISLLYGARSPQDVLYPRQLDRWRRAEVDVRVTVDRASEDWTGEVGVVTRQISRAVFDPQNVVVMVCGPEIMMRFTIAELEKLGVGPDQIFLSLERNMKCAVGLCGHCQFGPTFVCKDGPVFSLNQLNRFFWTREV